MSKLQMTDVLGIIKLIKLNFGKEFNVSSKDELEAIVRQWHKSLSKYPRELVLEEFGNVMEYAEFAPKLATILARLRAIENLNAKTPEQLWEELDNAVYKASQIVYYAEHPIFDARGKVEQRSVSEQLKELYSGLDPVIKEYIPSASGLVRLTEMDSLEYEKGRFMRYLPEMQNTCNLRAKCGNTNLELENADKKLLENLQ